MIKRIMAMGIVCSMIFAMSAQESIVNASEPSGPEEVANVIDGLEETELVEDTDESCYVVLYDVEVTSELVDNDTVNITLTNTSDFAIADWIVAYESAYDIFSIDNAELIMNSQVIGFKALDIDNTLESGESITVVLGIIGTYYSDIEYRVYGICDEVSQDFSVVDYISYDATTGKKTLKTFDYENMTEITSTQGLDVITTDMSSLSDVVAPLSIIPDDDCTCPSGSNCICYCTCEDTCTCITTCSCDGRRVVSDVNVSPYNKIAVIIIEWSNGEVTSGTGFLIGSKHLMTSAHCVYNEERGVVESITAYFGAKGYTYSSRISASNWTCSFLYTLTKSVQNDWGHIELSSSPGRGYFSLTSSVTTSNTLTVCGYPGDRKVWNEDATVNNKLVYMYKMSGVATDVNSESLRYEIDTYKGQSGSPI